MKSLENVAGLQEMNESEIKNVNGGFFLSFDWGLFTKASIAGAAIGGSVYVARMYV